MTEIHQLLTNTKRRGGISMQIELIASYYETRHLEVSAEINGSDEGQKMTYIYYTFVA